MRRRLAWVVGVMVVAIAGSGAWAAPVELTLHIDGLACPFCAYGMEKNLKAIRAVQSVEIEIDEGLVEIQSEGALPPLEKLQAAVGDAGFTLRAIELQAAGRVRALAELEPTLRKRAELVLRSAQEQKADLLEPLLVFVVGEGKNAAPLLLLAGRTTEERETVSRLLGRVSEGSVLSLKGSIPVPKEKRARLLPLLRIQALLEEPAS